MLAPIAPAPATRIIGARASPARRRSGVRSGARTSGPIGTPRRAATDLRGRLERKPVELAPESIRLVGSLLRTARGRARRSPPDRRRRGPDTAPAAPPASPRATSDSAPTKMSSPSRRYGSTFSHGLSETLSPRRFGTRSRSRSITAIGHGIAAARRELVDVERKRRARRRGSGEMRLERRCVQREEGRGDHRDGVGSRLRRVRR